MEKAIQRLLSRHKEVEAKLGSATSFDNQRAWRELTQEHAYLSSIEAAWTILQQQEKQIADNKELLQSESDPEFISILKDDTASLEIDIEKRKAELETLLIPPDPNDSRSTILELRAGTGGEEAALFVADCSRMYRMYSDKMGWKYETLSYTPSDFGGFKDYVMVLSGKDVYRFLRYEAGTHRVQRVPATEAQGRIHTSAITVAVLLEPDESDEIVVDERDLRIDTFRSSGAGGQHVNTTDSAVRITHMPTGIVVGCQEERSQHKNRDKAMRLLVAKLAELDVEKRHKEMADDRAAQVGSGDRSERIRTYNFPQNRLTEHRIGLTCYNLDQVMEGELGRVTEGLVAHFRQRRLD